MLKANTLRSTCWTDHRLTKFIFIVAIASMYAYAYNENERLGGNNNEKGHFQQAKDGQKVIAAHRNLFANNFNVGFETGDITNWEDPVKMEYITVYESSDWNDWKAPYGRYYAAMEAGCAGTPSILRRTFTGVAGETIFGAVAWDGGDKGLFEDTGLLKILQSNTILFEASISKYGDKGNSIWTSFEFTLPENGSFTLQMEAENFQDCLFDSFMLLDMCEETGANCRPTAIDDEVEGLEDGVIALLHVLDNDSDPEGEVLSFIEATATIGEVFISQKQVGLFYLPLKDFCGEDTIKYTIADASGNLASAFVKITVRPVATCQPIVSLDLFEELLITSVDDGSCTTALKSLSSTTFSSCSDYFNPPGVTLSVAIGSIQDTCTSTVMLEDPNGTCRLISKRTKSADAEIILINAGTKLSQQKQVSRAAAKACQIFENRVRSPPEGLFHMSCKISQQKLVGNDLQLRVEATFYYKCTKDKYCPFEEYGGAQYYLENFFKGKSKRNAFVKGLKNTVTKLQETTDVAVRSIGFAPKDPCAKVFKFSNCGSTEGCLWRSDSKFCVPESIGEAR